MTDPKEKTLTEEKKESIYSDIRSLYINKSYTYEQIFTDSGYYDDIEKGVIYDFVIPLLDIIDSEGSIEFERAISLLRKEIKGTDK